ncbi:sodium-coupled neutral amino acid transporter 10 isoform X1 [Brachionus plicatilis]|uniref:Sodium-coupled neutral amino acid transporter 10 isoform X1 n=1 Tax=Brachionus plicatilis TaxID=10195 RepID=A0A3M7T930_BRAPC|nr:sodium-coupled neutral amino acid transporter 10 isoform X1 [Brachionus plicatilis]
MIEVKEKMTQGITLKNLVSMTNGVVGLSILTMPYCFKECGLLLGTLTLLFCALMCSYSCKLIIKTIQIAKINSFEYLAFKTFGEKGKLLIEICIIFLLFGSLVTNQQALCDTGPAFVSKLFNLHEKAIPRSVFMFIFTLLISLPLALSKKLEALQSLNASAILFYFTFGLYLMWEAGFKLMDHVWFDKIRLWHFSGLLKCFPIFSISFSCQTLSTICSLW